VSSIFPLHCHAGRCRRSAPGTLTPMVLEARNLKYDIFCCPALQGSGAELGSVYGVQGKTLVVYIMSVEGSTRTTLMESSSDTQSVFLSEGWKYLMGMHGTYTVSVKIPGTHGNVFGQR
jgi:hypothetical protein